MPRLKELVIPPSAVQLMTWYSQTPTLSGGEGLLSVSLSGDIAVDYLDFVMRLPKVKFVTVGRGRDSRFLRSFSRLGDNPSIEQIRLVGVGKPEDAPPVRGMTALKTVGGRVVYVRSLTDGT
jgi:hypothetical protein